MAQAPPTQTQPPNAQAFPTPPFWEGLLQTLEAQGFTVGVAQLLRLEALLRRLPPDTPAERYKYLLAPLFVTDETQQTKFYALCDAFLKSHTERGTSSTTALNSETPRSRLRRAAPALILLLLALIISGPLYWRYVHSTPVKTVPAKPGKEIKKPPGDDHQKKNGAKHPEPKPPPGGTGKTPKPPETPDNATTSGAGPAQVPHNSSHFPFEIKIEARELPPIRSSESLPLSTLWEMIGWKGLIPVVLFPLALLALSAWLRHRRNAPKNLTPPFRWPLQVELPERSVHDVPLLLDTARRMRTRQVTDYAVLDIGRSIARTIGEGGFPTLVHRPATRRPEYLALIDRRSARDHLASFYGDLVHTFQREGIHAEYYFFDEEIRLCRREGSEESFTLAALTTKFADTHRLLIIADGNRLLDPVAGHLLPWASLFLKWRERALFLPETLPEWSARELEMQGLFWLFPADFRRLRDFLERLAGEERDDFDTRLALLEEAAPSLPDEFSEESLNALRKYLNAPAAFLWLCVCALYPELRWNLTLYLGGLASLPLETRSQENTRRLSRLDWFRAGAIPEAWRWELMERLPVEIAREAREAIVRLMERNMPPVGSYAEQSFRLELALQRWAADPTDENRAALGVVLREMRPEDILRRPILVKLLQAEHPNAGWRAVRRRAEGLLHEQGIPELGIRTSARLIFALLLMAAGFLALILVPVRSRPSTPNPVPNPSVTFNRNGMDFGGYETDQSTEAALILRNKTGSPFTVEKMRLEQSEPAFELDDPSATPLRVPPQGEASAIVRFHPSTKGKFTARLHLLVDRGRPEHIMPLVGHTTRTPPLQLDSLTFGEKEIGRPKVMRIRNLSEKPAHITVTLDNQPDFDFATPALRSRSAKLHDIAPKQAEEVAFVYHPRSPGIHIAKVTAQRAEGARPQSFTATLENLVPPPQRGRPLPFPLLGHTGAVASAAYSPNGQYIVTASNDKTARIWDATQGGSAITPQRKTVSDSGGTSLRLPFTLTGHTDVVRSAAYSSNGQYIVTASFDKTARIWDAQTGLLLHTLTGHTALVWTASYSPNGQYIVTASADHTARIWDATGRDAITPKHK